MNFDEPEPVTKETSKTRIGSKYTNDGDQPHNAWRDTTWKKARKQVEPDTDRTDADGKLKTV